MFPQLVEALLALPPRDSRDSGAQCETGALWKEKHAGRGCARVSLQGGRRGRQDLCAAVGWVGPELLFQRGQISWVVARESKLPNLPLSGPSHLTDFSAERLTNTLLVLGETFFF